MTYLPVRTLSTCVLCVIFLAACGGGGGSGSSTPPLVVGWQLGVFPPASTLAAKCAAPRVGVINPDTAKPYPDIVGTTLDEKNWLRSWSNDFYLWYNEILDTDPATIAATADYFKILKTMQKTTTGADRDKFHFTYATKDWQALLSGSATASYGPQWEFLSKPRTLPRQVVVVYSEPGAPATAMGIARGAEVLFVDGVDLANDNTQAGVATLNAGLFPATAGESHAFQVRDVGTTTTHLVTLVSANFTTQPVQNVKVISNVAGSVGYMLFNDHLANSEAALVSAFTQLQKAKVNDLVIDIRYNGGGLLDIASEVAFMVAGSARTSGQTFELQQFNSKYPNTNPFKNSAIQATPFYDHSIGFDKTLLAGGQPLPTLNLPRVFVLTGGSTCSASEAIINGLNGVNVQVIQIGSTTCGKPYGFYAQDNCSVTYFSIEFRGVNAANFGDYTDGFSAHNSVTPTNATLPGCSVADDFTHALGDPAEGRLAAALNYAVAPGICPAPAPTGISKALLVQQASQAEAFALAMPPTRQLRILTRR